VNGGEGINFLDNNFVSVNNTLSRTSTSVTSQRRLVSVFAQAVLDYNKYLYVTLQGRNDWTSTIPQERNSFFYPVDLDELRLLRRLPVDRPLHDGQAPRGVRAGGA
jgi:outer membrane receptor protein involved in Fe transport